MRKKILGMLTSLALILSIGSALPSFAADKDIAAEGATVTVDTTAIFTAKAGTKGNTYYVTAKLATGSSQPLAITGTAANLVIECATDSTGALAAAANEADKVNAAIDALLTTTGVIVMSGAFDTGVAPKTVLIGGKPGLKITGTTAVKVGETTTLSVTASGDNTTTSTAPTAKWTVSGTPANATVVETTGVVTGVAAGKSELSAEVTIDNEKVIATKDVTVTDKSTDATLTALKYAVDGGTATAVLGFAASTKTYNVELPVGTAPGASISWTATAADGNATVEADAFSLTTGIATSTVTVTAEDGTTKGVYTIKFTTAAFVPVTGIANVPKYVKKGEATVFPTDATPSSATNKSIAWTVKTDSSGTGAAFSGGSSSFTAATKNGTVVVTATVTNGATASTAFIKDYTVIVNSTGKAPDDNTPSGGGGAIADPGKDYTTSVGRGNNTVDITYNFSRSFLAGIGDKELERLIDRAEGALAEFEPNTTTKTKDIMDKIKSTHKDAKTFGFNFDGEEALDFGFKAEVTIPVKGLVNADYYLYYVAKGSKVPAYVGVAEVMRNEATFTLSHASEYFLSSIKLASNDPALGEPTTESEAPIDTAETTAAETAAPVAPEATNPATGNAAPIALLVCAVAAAAVVIAKRK